jgi:hypothetical protein
LHDQQTGNVYVSTAMPNGAEGGAFRDFGYFSTFAGLNARLLFVSSRKDDAIWSGVP